jgi:hypothetical protein
MLVTRPVVSHLTDTMWDFSNSSAVYMHFFPQLAGQTVAGMAGYCASTEVPASFHVIGTALHSTCTSSHSWQGRPRPVGAALCWHNVLGCHHVIGAALQSTCTSSLSCEDRLLHMRTAT